MFAALALGSWHWPEAEQPNRDKGGDQLYLDATPRMKQQMGEALRRLTAAAGDFNPQVRTAALLALAKRGGIHAANAVKGAAASASGAVPEVAWASLIAQAFLGERTGAPYLSALLQGDRRLKRAAALAVSVGALQQGSGETEWGREPGRILATLESADLRATEGPEIMFARGVLVWKHQKTERYKAIFDIAVNPRTEREVAVAATQVLLFCEQEWFKRELVRWVRGEGDFKLRKQVLAGFLLLAASRGSAEGIEAVARYLTQPGRRPKGTREWDVRFYAAVGLARAFSEGRLVASSARAKALDALRGGLLSMHKQAPFRAALAQWLETNSVPIESDPHFRPLEQGVRRLEAAFVSRHALLSRDLTDACVHRVNRFTMRMLQVDNVQAVPAGSPEQSSTPLLILKADLEAFPYFSWREFLWERGARPAFTLGEGDPRSIDR